MSTIDPSTIRKAIAEFKPKRPPKFHELLAAKEWIVELRQKGASYESIADLLTQHYVPISTSGIAMFCHQVLGESVRPRRRPGRRRSPASTSTNGGATTSDAMPASEPSKSAEPSANSNGNEASLARTRGPRIAQIRKLTPQHNEKTDSHP
ncbi:MAG: hypothetical protein ABSC89_07920 [Verrucomicrobiota bacterium]|jgi:hypothetical protein